MMENRQKTIVVKIGTAALTKQDGSVDIGVLASLVEEMAAVKKQGHRLVVVTSGAVGVGKTLLEESAFPKACDEVTRKQIWASVGQPHLMQIYQSLFDAAARNELKVSQSLLTKEHFGTPEHLQRMLAMSLLMPQILPVFNENDSVAIRELFTDNDELASDLAQLIKADHLIILSGIDAVYTSDPRRDPLARKIPYINALTDAGADIDTTGKTDCGRGGMESKLEAVLSAARAGIVVDIATSREINVIGRLLGGEIVGTRIEAKPVAVSRPGWGMSRGPVLNAG